MRMRSRSSSRFRCRTCNLLSTRDTILCVACGGVLRGNGDADRLFARRCHVLPLHAALRDERTTVTTITMNSEHLANNSHCPVCLDQFHVGTEAREFQCSHIYHSNCIIPWLANHMTCPVCRRPLPSEDVHLLRRPDAKTIMCSSIYLRCRC